MKHRWLFNALAVLFLVTGVFGSFANTPVAIAATGESSSADKIEPALLDKFNQEGTVDFIVRFNEQADLSPAYSMGWTERGEYVYNTLREIATRAQARAKGMLDGAGLEYQTFIAGNDLYVTAGTLAVATDLAALEEVYYIRATRTYYIDPVAIENPLANVSWSGELLARNLSANVGDPDALAWGITYTKADQFWTAFGVQGDGIKVANIDTGVQWNHPALDQSYGCPGDPGNASCWADPSNICGGTPCDNNGHGTHTMGTMVADDDPSLTYQAGMAPNSTWIACKGCETNSCSDAALNACADWALAPGGDTNNRPDVLNNSWGGGGGDNWYLAKVQAWRAAGIFPAFSAGNAGSSCNTLGSPGDYQESFASAAIDVAGNVASFSSRGPSAFGHDPYTKPNISAPGVSVCSTVPTNSWSCGYSGTSMASPHSAGAVALLWSCNPSLVGMIDQTFEILQDTADVTPAGNCSAPPDGEGNYTYGYGYLNVLDVGTAWCGDVDTGTLEGYVLDNNGAPIEGATVNAAPAAEGNGIQATTDPNGFYTMDLVVGTYDVTAFKTNYTSQTQTNVQVISGTVVTLPDFILNFLGAWTLLDPLPGCPDWTRYDGAYFPGDGMVYFMGGRSDTSTFPDIYQLDPNLGQCTDTGANMVTGISNYTIVPLTIDGTDVLCTFGGRDPNGNNTDDVQCYDPVANTVTVESNLPASYYVFSPGGSVAVNNKAYVFGGFRATSAPYETAATWEWDPATDTWTQKGDLVQALGYLQPTVVNGLIYAFGGTVFDGTNLTAQTKAQVFDPVAGIWDDAAVTDLPTAGAEGRAYTVGEQIVVAGGGQWPGETLEAFLYDVASDSYDYSFPDLNVSRRDHAGVFVPGTPDTLWVFGGRTGGVDTPPYAPPEYYAVGSNDPDIAVNPTFIDETVALDTPTTVNLDVMNVGGGVITWTLFEDTAAVGPLVDWSDNFDSYATDSSLHGQGGWKGWFNDPAATAYARDEQAISLPNSVEIAGASDLVHEYTGATSGLWTYTANQYIPSTVSGITYFILLNSYDDAGIDLNWSLELQFDTTTDTLINDGPDGGTLPITYDQWVEISVVIDLDADTQTVYYGGDLLFTGSWTDGMSGGGVLNIAAVDLYANSATSVYYDDLSLVESASAVCDAPTDVPWLSANPTAGVLPGGSTDPVAVTLDPTGMGIGTYNANLCVASNDADEPIVQVPVTMNVVEEIPDIEVDPLFFDVTVFADETATYDLSIANVGSGTLDWTIAEVLGTQRVTPPVQSASRPAGQPVVLSMSNGPAMESAPAWQPDAEVNLILDDGTRENDIGLGGTIEMLWVNRFTPNEADFPFYIDQVAIYFSSVGLVNVGDDITLILYENTSGNNDPAVGSNFLASFPVTVQVLDDWNVYTLPSQVVFNGPGDVVIGAIGLETPGTSYWPASMDQTASQQRSWAGWWNSSPPPTPPTLPPDNWTLIDVYFPGNWMVRASGQTQDVVDVPWLSEDPTSGQNDATVAVTFDPSSVGVGQYFASLSIESNDPDEPVVNVPVTMTVIEKAAGVMLTPETDAQSGDPGAVVEYTLVLENTGNLADTFTVEATGVWAFHLPVTSFTLLPGETANVVVHVTIPADAAAGASDVTTVTATSAFDDTVSDFSELTTTANQVFGIELTPATDALTGAPGEVVEYTLTLVNTGNGEDTVALAAAGNLWDVDLSAASVTLAAGASAEITVQVTIPADAVDGAMDVVTVTATSEGGPTASSVLTTTAEVVPPEGYITVLPIVFRH